MKFKGFKVPLTFWNPHSFRHFPGELMSVKPGVVSAFPGLFHLNERVAWLGRWRHGFFSMTAVGATNVGSIHASFDRELQTNQVRKHLLTRQQSWSPSDLPSRLSRYAASAPWCRAAPSATSTSARRSSPPSPSA